MAVNDTYWPYAVKAGTLSGLDPKIIYCQWYHETGNFSNWGCKTGFNLGGLMKFRAQPDWFKGDSDSKEGFDYQVFNSYDDFATYYGGTYLGLYKDDGLLAATDIPSWAEALHKGGYYTDSVANYTSGLQGAYRECFGGEAGKFTAGGVTANPYSSPQPAGWGDKVLKAAETFVGKVWLAGGDGKAGIDDGHLALATFKLMGMDLGKATAAEICDLCVYKRTFFKEKKNALKGDLIFFMKTGKDELVGPAAPANVQADAKGDLIISKADAPPTDVATHIGIYAGGDKIIHAYETTGVAYLDMTDYFLPRILGFARIVPEDPKNKVTPVTTPGTAANIRATTAIPYEEGYVYKRWAHGKHVDVGVKKRPKTEYNDARKTFCEPMYPDMVGVIGAIPPWVMANLKLKDSDMVIGPNMVFSIAQDKLQALYGVNVDQFLGSSQEIQDRQIVFNPKDYKKKAKVLNPGKPVNNGDPYPTDGKISELQEHQPRVKLEKIEMCSPSDVDVQLATEIIGVSDRTEKRIVKLENILAVVLRNLWRLAARMPINCVYYGGQSIYQKYCSIRCLHDNRLRDGGTMSLDQCMNCTRYEPILGQCYDIMNEQGVSLKNEQDNLQMSYSDMQDLVEQNRVEEYHTARKPAKIDMTLINARDKTEKDFKDIWPAGMKMNWALVPVEDQVNSVNPRQDYGGSSSSQTASGFGKNTAGGGSLKCNEAMAAIMKANFDAMASSSSPYAAASGQMAGKADGFMSKMKSFNFEKELDEIASANSMDPVLVAAICVVESGGDPDAGVSDHSYWGLMQTVRERLVAQAVNFAGMSAIDQAKNGMSLGCKMYREKTTAVGSTNPVLGCIGYNAGEGLILGCQGAALVERLDQNPIGVAAKLSWGDKDKWLWTQIVDALADNVKKAFPTWSLQEKCEYFPKVCGAYMALKDKMKTSIMASPDGKYGFPFAQENLHNVHYTGKFGDDRGDHLHGGVDLFAGDDSQGMPILAIANGTIDVCDYQDGGAGNYVRLDHGNGWSSRYMHMCKPGLPVGSVVKMGDTIGFMGTTGASTGPHTHFEIGQGGCASQDVRINAEVIFPLLIGKSEKDGFFGPLV